MMNDVFQSVKTFELEDAKFLNDHVGETLALNDFEIYESDKHSGKFSVIQNADGVIYTSWGAAVYDLLYKIKTTKKPEEWQDYPVTVAQVKTKNNNKMIVLQDGAGEQ